MTTTEKIDKFNIKMAKEILHLTRNYEQSMIDSQWKDCFGEHCTSLICIATAPNMIISNNVLDKLGRSNELFDPDERYIYLYIEKGGGCGMAENCAQVESKLVTFIEFLAAIAITNCPSKRFYQALGM